MGIINYGLRFGEAIRLDSLSKTTFRDICSLAPMKNEFELLRWKMGCGPFSKIVITISREDSNLFQFISFCPRTKN